MKRAHFLLFTMLFAVQCMAQSVVNRLDITVSLADNGNAHIHEVWNINIGKDVKTEWYVAHHNMEGRTIQNLVMTDDGKPVATVKDEWDDKADHKDKIGKCGIKEAEGGYEICWGVSEWRNHVYTADYDITGFVQSYNDTDGFGYWFADLNADDPIRIFSITIAAPKKLTAKNTNVWGFGYKGIAEVKDGKVLAQGSDSIKRVGLLLSMDKGLLHPANNADGTFAELKNEAFKGSSFSGGSDDEPMPTAFWVILGGVFAAAVGGAGAWGIRLDRKRKKARQLPYCNAPSSSWTLLGAAKVLDEYKWLDDDNFISAIILRLISQRKLEIIDDDKVDKKGKHEKALRIVPENVEKPTGNIYSDDYICDYMLYVMSKAVGDKKILTPKKLEKWAGKHEKAMEELDEAIHPDDEDIAVDEADRQQILGLRNYLLDFGTAGEKRVDNVSVWDNRLVYSQLFGIAKKLGEDIQAICPEYYELSAFGSEVRSIYLYYPYFLHNWSDSVSTSTSEATSSSGSTSIGGGGGFSGGGGGGGR